MKHRVTSSERKPFDTLSSMPWHLLPPPPTKERERELHRITARRCKFLVDENLGPGVAIALDYLGHNVKFGPNVGLGGKSDQDVFAFAWREKRVLLTHDDDFLNDQQFPFNRNPGVIVLPGKQGEFEPLSNAIQSMLNIFGEHGNIYPNAKISIDSENIWTIRSYIKQEGRIKRSTLKFTRNNVYEWYDPTRGVRVTLP